MDAFFSLVSDDSGFIVSLELVLIATILVIGLLAGLTALRDAVVSELSDVAGAVQDMNQSYRLTGTSSRSATTSGSGYDDQNDWCDSPNASAGRMDNCITVFGPTNER